MPCISVEVHGHLGGIHSFCLKAQRVSQTGNQKEEMVRKVDCFLLAGFLLSLLFSPEGGGRMFLRNVSELLSDRTGVTSQKADHVAGLYPEPDGSSTCFPILFLEYSY
jgi:hypothetical protein